MTAQRKQHAFGDFELDESLYELRRDGAPIKLEPKVFDVLRYLVDHHERVVSKDELLEQLWPGEFVSESVLPRCIVAVRKALGDDPAAPRFIQTIHGRGYRFVAAVRPAPGGQVAVGATPGEVAEEPRVFVGREDAMAHLRSAVDQAFAGRGQLVLLLGEPGIGKTRTAEELAEVAARRGALVATGRCHEGEGAVREYDGGGKVVWDYPVPMFGRKPKDGHGPEGFGNACFAAVRVESTGWDRSRMLFRLRVVREVSCPTIDVVRPRQT